MITVPSQSEGRICSLQKTLKDKAMTHIMAQYKLHAGCKPLVTAFLTGQSYIFPGDVMNVCGFTDTRVCTNFYLLYMFSVASTVQRSTPYGHPIFAAIHAEVFFKTKLSLRNIYSHHFTNSIEGSDPCEHEIPLAMLELVATTVSSYIHLWLIKC
jgi:hypothetical protein